MGVRNVVHLYMQDSIVVIVKVNLDLRKLHIKYDHLCMATRDPALVTLLEAQRSPSDKGV